MMSRRTNTGSPLLQRLGVTRGARFRSSLQPSGFEIRAHTTALSDLMLVRGTLGGIASPDESLDDWLAKPQNGLFQNRERCGQTSNGPVSKTQSEICGLGSSCHSSFEHCRWYGL